MSGMTTHPLRPLGGRLRRAIFSGVTEYLGERGTLMAGAALAMLVASFCLLGPIFCRASPYTIHVGDAFYPPSPQFLLGTDQIGRDELARLIAGGYTTLAVSIPAAILAFIVGIVFGFSGALGPIWLDKVLMRVLDAVLALPALILLIFFASLFAPSNSQLILLLGLTSWPGLARLVRNEAIAQRGRDFVHASRQCGAGTFYIAWRHLLPVIAPVLVVNGTFLVGDQILALSALSFLGLGIQPPDPSWGGLLQSGLNLVVVDPWWMIVPSGAMIFLSIAATNLIGQGILARMGETC